MADDLAPDAPPDPELLDAIEAAARHVGRASEDPTAAPLVVRFDPPPQRRARVWLLLALLLVSAAGSAYLALRPRDEPDPEVVEADLRWAVAQVVRRVELVHRQTGHFPAPEELSGLVSDLVVYEPLGDGFWVVGRRGPVRVVFDGSVPLARWEGLRLYGGGSESP